MAHWQKVNKKNSLQEPSPAVLSGPAGLGAERGIAGPCLRLPRREGQPILVTAKDDERIQIEMKTRTIYKYKYYSLKVLPRRWKNNARLDVYGECEDSKLCIILI